MHLNVANFYHVRLVPFILMCIPCKMNKSTPLNQLPVNMPPTGFVNDQQKQMITQAQQAIGNMNMPQNTQAAEIAAEDDATIQEVLNQISGSSTMSQTPMMPSQEMPSQLPPMHQQPVMMNHYSMPSPMELNALYGMSQTMNMAPPTPASHGVASSLDQFVRMFADDIKTATIVFIVVVGVHMVPVEKLLGNYFAIDKIPYHDILLKAVLAAVGVLLLRRFVAK